MSLPQSAEDPRSLRLVVTRSEPVDGPAAVERPARFVHGTFTGVEEQLLTSVARQDPKAFRQLYDRFAPRVYGLAMRTLRDEHYAQEVVQEVFMELWRIGGRFDPARSSAQTFVMMLAHRRSVDRVRSEQSNRDRAAVGARKDETAVASHEDDTVDILHLKHERTAVRSALGALTDLQREAIELAYFHGFTYPEVAAYLGAPLGTVKSRIRDGLLRLRVELWSRP